MHTDPFSGVVYVFRAKRAVNRRRNLTPFLEWAPWVGQVQTADLTMSRVCCSSNCAGLR